MKTHTSIDSPIGTLTLVNTEGLLSGVYMQIHARMPHPDSFGVRSGDGFDRAIEELGEYFSGERTVFSLPAAPVGTDFQHRVWSLLKQIPYGQTRSYSQLADQLGDRRVQRAVGAANGRNPLSVIVPCHRVVGANGSLTGYAGGLDRKKLLLSLENSARVEESQLF